jgi:hypothetical protein
VQGVPEIHAPDAHPLCALARVLRGAIEHEDGMEGFRARSRMKTCEAGNQMGNIGVRICRQALRS